MTINYALMVEVQKTISGYRFKLQYDSRALSEGQADEVLRLFEGNLSGMGEPKKGEGELKREVKIGDLMGLSSGVDGLWKI